MPDRFKPLLILILSLPLPLLGGCGSSKTHAISSQLGLPQHQANTNSALQSPTSEDADLVSAVSQSGSDATLSVKFRLAERPVVGTPVAIELALFPGPEAGITHIHGSLQASEGLQLQSQRTFDIATPQAGGALRQEVTVIPQQDGVLSLSATILIDFDNGSLARTYSIPLIAADHAS
jgi:hypothetical protein